MKKALLILVILITASVAWSQESAQDYIYSEQGFVVKQGRSTETFGEFDGLYSADGKILVCAYTYYSGKYVVIYGTEVIGPHAFAGFKPSSSDTAVSIYIPSTVKYIAPEALVHPQGMRLHFYVNDSGYDMTTGASTPKPTTNHAVVAQYNHNGLPANSGIVIEQYDDNTSGTVLRNR